MYVIPSSYELGPAKAEELKKLISFTQEVAYVTLQFQNCSFKVAFAIRIIRYRVGIGKPQGHDHWN